MPAIEYTVRRLLGSEKTQRKGHPYCLSLFSLGFNYKKLFKRLNSPERGDESASLGTPRNWMSFGGSLAGAWPVDFSQDLKWPFVATFGFVFS